MFKTVLVANRGEIAARIVRTLRRLGIQSVGVASEADRFTAPMRDVDRLVRLDAGPPAETYLNIGSHHDSILFSRASTPPYDLSMKEEVQFSSRH